MRLTPRATRIALILILAVSAAAILGAMRQTSTTFDEIVMIAGGARGYETGEWDLAPEHPPFTQYMYGLVPYLAGSRYPDEKGVTAEARKHMGFRYRYAQFFFWGSGNNPERAAFLGRLPAAACAVLLALLAFAFAQRHYGDTAGLIAAALVAFLPDVLAHGGVSYNDLPIAVAYFAAIWLIDRAIRQPALSTAMAAGAMIGLALGVKNSAVALAPAAVLVLIAEAVVRRGDRDWLKRIAPAALFTLVSAYIALVLVYRGDVTLAEYRYSLSFVSNQVSATNAPGYLLGRISASGIPYYFPVTFLYKTSLGFHVLLALAIWYWGSRMRSVRQVLQSPLRAPAIGAIAFGLILARSNLNIGFRYALPLLPMLAVIVAAAAARIMQTDWHRLRIAVAIAAVWAVAHPLSYYPHFLTYVSEYGPGRKKNYEVVADSSLDWGQGLLLLRDYMREHDIGRIYLSYFGSAWPGGYGINYRPLTSFFDLPALTDAPADQPKYVAISATNLTGAYFRGDPFKQFRDQKPEAVLGNSIYVYRLSN